MAIEESAAAAARNETYKHLEDPMRMSGLTIGQLAALAGATIAAIVFGLYISPLPTGVTMALCIFLAGLPVAVSYAVSGFDVSIADTITALYRWARGAKHFLPGAGNVPAGYVVAQVSTDHLPPARAPDEVAKVRQQLEGAWDG